MHIDLHNHTNISIPDRLVENEKLIDATSQNVDLPLNTTSAGPTQSVPFLDAVLEVEYALDDVGLEFVTELLVLLISNFGQRDSLLFSERYSSAGDVMGLSERYLLFDAQNNVSARPPCIFLLLTDPFSDQVIGKISGKHVCRQGFLHLFFVDLTFS